MEFFSSFTGAKEKEERLEELKKECVTYENNRQFLAQQAVNLYNHRKLAISVILNIVNSLKSIENLPKWCSNDVEDSLKRTKDFRLAVEYEKNPAKFAELTDNTGRTAAYVAGGGAVAGAGVAVFGTTGAMSIATLLGTASTGAAISTLSGAAATNAALAWLGGGAIATGGAGIAGGSLVLSMFGPVGAIIAGVGALSGFAILKKSNRQQAQEASKYIVSIQHDNDNMQQKRIHLNELITRSQKSFKKLKDFESWSLNVNPKDYKLWDDNQKREIERLMNAVSNCAMLINERI